MLLALQCSGQKVTPIWPWTVNADDGWVGRTSAPNVGADEVEQRAPRLADGLAGRRGAGVARARRTQIVDDVEPGVEILNGYARAPSEAEAERTEIARGDASSCAALDVHRSEGVGLRREREDGDGEVRRSEKERENAPYLDTIAPA
jgi:hypothetical protein